MRAIYFNMPGAVSRTLRQIGIPEKDVKSDVDFLLGMRSSAALSKYLHRVAFSAKKPLMEEVKDAVRLSITGPDADKVPAEKTRTRGLIRKGRLAIAIGDVELFNKYLFESIGQCTVSPGITAAIWASHVGMYFPSTDRMQDIKRSLLEAGARQELMRLAMATLHEIELVLPPSIRSSHGSSQGAFLGGAMKLEQEAFHETLKECVAFFETQGSLKTREELVLMHFAYLYLGNAQAADLMLKRIRLPKAERFFEAEAAGNLAKAERILWGAAMVMNKRLWQAVAFYTKHRFLSARTNGYVEAASYNAIPHKGVDALLEYVICLNNRYPKGNPEMKKGILNQEENVRNLWLMRLANAFVMDPTDIGTMKAVCVLREMQRDHELRRQTPQVYVATTAYTEPTK